MVDPKALENSNIVFSSNGFLKPDRWVMARNHEYKYIYNYNQGAEELYDLVNDAGEVNNLAVAMKDSDVLKELKKKAIEYEKKWGPDGGILNGTFVVLDGEKHPAHKHGKYLIWSNIQRQKFAQKDPVQRGARLVEEMKIAFSNEEISGKNMLQKIGKNET